MNAGIFIGCAGWGLSRPCAEAFPGEGSHLERYARRLPVVEINSSFYRPHRPATYVRWAASVPEDFRFAVKVPKEITHVRRLYDCDELLDRFLSEAGGLGAKLGPLLVQLPPSLGFDAGRAEGFFDRLRARFDGAVVCEPRHAGWFEHRAEALLSAFRVARVGADPPAVPAALQPGGWPGLVYIRLHGSPKMYYSAYGEDRVAAWIGRLRAAEETAPAWCIFDNTAEGAALPDALTALRMAGEAVAPGI
jgi:uncharacterized protein YecE (DUF72 family)